MRLLRALSSSLNHRRLHLRPLTPFLSSHLSTAAKQQRATTPPAVPEQPDTAAPGGGDPKTKPKRANGIRRPMEVPWQARMENVVHLIGSISEPLELFKAKDGEDYAVTILNSRDGSLFWIPIVFKGEIARTAALSVTVKDVVYITGELSKYCPKLSAKDHGSTHQVSVDTLGFVRSISLIKDMTKTQEKAEVSNGKAEKVDNHLHREGWQMPLMPLPVKSDVKKFEPPGKVIWNDLIENPEAWFDYRMQKQDKLVSPRFPDFKHVTTNVSIWLDSLPEWVGRKINGLIFAKPDTSSTWKRSPTESRTVTNAWGSAKGSYKKSPDSTTVTNAWGGPKSSYKISPDLMTATNAWGGPKSSYKKSPESTTGTKAWGNPKSSYKTSPVLRLKLWRNLVDDPDKWVDNRLKKTKPNQPDFVNVETGEALWLGSSTPLWVTDRLLPLPRTA